MVPPVRPEPDAGAVIQIKTAALLLALRHFKAFLPPDALHPLVIDVPALDSKH
jgi:hypothetical protein